MKNISLTLLFFFTSFATSRAQSWFNLRNGSDALNVKGRILTICSDTANNIYAAGYFTDTLQLPYGKTHVAKWDASVLGWSILGTGSNALKGNGKIRTICADGFGNVYAAGDFSDSPAYYKYVAKWDGTQWSELGTGSNALNVHGVIKSICADKAGNVYAAGNFINASGYYYVAKWNGINWSEIGSLKANLFINSICVDDSFNVYAGGDFTDSSGNQYVAKWNHSINIWSEIGLGFDSTSGGVTEVRAIMVDSSKNIYAAVNYVTGGILFKWDGTNWHQLGLLNANGLFETICHGDSGLVYAAGGFTNATGRKYVSKYDPKTNLWGELGYLNAHCSYDADAYIFTLCTDRLGHVYAAGGFSDSISYANNYYYVAEYGEPPPNLAVNTEEHERTIIVYPNPTHNTLTITTASSSPNTELTIADMYGRLVLTKKLALQKETVDVSTLAPGVYVYCVTANGTPIKAGKLEKY